MKKMSKSPCRVSGASRRVVYSDHRCLLLESYFFCFARSTGVGSLWNGRPISSPSVRGDSLVSFQPDFLPDNLHFQTPQLLLRTFASNRLRLFCWCGYHSLIDQSIKGIRGISPPNLLRCLSSLRRLSRMHWRQCRRSTAILPVRACEFCCL